MAADLPLQAAASETVVATTNGVHVEPGVAVRRLRVSGCVLGVVKGIRHSSESWN